MSYDVIAESEDDNILSLVEEKISCVNCSATFTAQLRTNMQVFKVTSVSPDDIEADTSAPPHVVQADGQADDQADDSNQSEDSMMMYILIGAGGFVVCLLITVMLCCRRSSAAPEPKTKDVAVPLESTVEMRSNPMKNTSSHAASSPPLVGLKIG